MPFLPPPPACPTAQVGALDLSPGASFSPYSGPTISSRSTVSFLGCFYKSKGVRVCALSRVQLFCDPVDYSPPAPLTMGCPRQEYRSGLPFPSPGDLPDPGFKPASPVALILAGRLFITEPQNSNNIFQNTEEN